MYVRVKALFDKRPGRGVNVAPMAKPLVIVESPAKARTIEGFLGGEFTVLASMGHIRDLPAKGLSVDVDNDFKVDYEVHASKKDDDRRAEAGAQGRRRALPRDG